MKYLIESFKSDKKKWNEVYCNILCRNTRMDWVIKRHLQVYNSSVNWGGISVFLLGWGLVYVGVCVGNIPGDFIWGHLMHVIPRSIAHHMLASTWNRGSTPKALEQ